MRGAFGSSAYRRASAIIASASSIGRLTPEETTGLPAKRPRSRTPTSTAKMTASAVAIVSWESGDEPADPWVSTLEVDAGPLGRGLQGLGRHVGVGDPGRAGGDGDQAATPGGRSRRCLGASEAEGGRGRGGGALAEPELPVHQLDDVVDGRGGAQGVGEGRLDQCPGELGEDLEVVGVAAGGRGDQEHEVGRAVLGPEVDAGLEPGEGEGRLRHPGGAAVRDGDPARQSGRRGLLAGERVGHELVDVRGPAGVADDARPVTG